MPIPRWRWLSTPHIHRRRTELALLVLLATLLQLAAGTGLAYLAGFSRVQTVLGHLDWTWLIALGGVLLVSFAGYYYAYRGIFRVEDGPPLPRPHLGAVVVAGFGGFLAHGGGALDRYALEAAGADTTDARMRVNALAGLEQGILSIVGCGAALAVLVSGLAQPPADFTIPWATVPIPGFLIAFWAAERYRDRFRRRGGWRGTLSTLLDSVHLIRELFAHPWRWASALLGMALFWAAEVFAAWAGLAAFGLRMNATALIIGFTTGMLFTRRIGPLGGAGLDRKSTRLNSSHPSISYAVFCLKKKKKTQKTTKTLKKKKKKKTKLHTHRNIPSKNDAISQAAVQEHDPRLTTPNRPDALWPMHV